MNPNQPVVGIIPPSGHRRFTEKIRGVIRTLKTKWLALSVIQRVLCVVAAFTVLIFIIFGLWFLVQKPAKVSEDSKPEISKEEEASDESTPTETTDPAADDSTEQDSSKPGQSSKPGTSGTGGSGGGGSNNGGGGSGSGGGGGGGGEVTPPAEFPNADNTGPQSCTSWTDYDGDLDIDVDGTVLNCITLDGTLTINANNVTVQNAILRGTSWWGVRVGNTKSDATNFKLLHSRLYTIPGDGPDNGGYDYGISQESTGYMEIGYNHITGYKDGVTTAGSYIHDNYIHDLSQFDGAHTQAVYVYTGPNQVKIEHNTLINDSPEDQATAAIYIAPDDGHQNNRIVDRNFLAGGAYTIYGGDSTATNIVVTNNKFSTQIWPDGGKFGWAGYWWPGNAGNVWSGNTWADGANIDQAVNP